MNLLVIRGDLQVPSLPRREHKGGPSPDIDVYDLDRPMRSWRCPARVDVIGERTLLCVAQDVPRKALLLLLSEWVELKRQRAALPWKLLVKTSAIDPRVKDDELVAPFWRRVAALKRQLRVQRAGVYFCRAALPRADYDRLVDATFGSISTSLGEGFCAPIASAMLRGKPVVAPRHTAFADYVPQTYPYAFATRPTVVRFVDDPLHVYHPASTWEVPEPGAVAAALARLIANAESGRVDEVCRDAQRRVRAWCAPDRVRALLADEIERVRVLRQDSVRRVTVAV